MRVGVPGRREPVRRQDHPTHRRRGQAADAAARTGIEFEEAWKALRTLGLPEEAMAGIGTRALRQLEKGCVQGAARSGVVRAAGGGGAYCKWLELGGPGTWMVETEGLSQADRAYEQLVTNGVPSGISYKVPAAWRKFGYVKFDGYQNGTLIDAKNQALTDSMFTAEGKLQKWVTSPLKQATDQAEQQETCRSPGTSLMRGQPRPSST